MGLSTLTFSFNQVRDPRVWMRSQQLSTNPLIHESTFREVYYTSDLQTLMALHLGNAAFANYPLVCFSIGYATDQRNVQYGFAELEVLQRLTLAATHPLSLGLVQTLQSLDRRLRTAYRRSCPQDSIIVVQRRFARRARSPHCCVSRWENVW